MKRDRKKNVASGSISIAPFEGAMGIDGQPAERVRTLTDKDLPAELKVMMAQVRANANDKRTTDANNEVIAAYEQWKLANVERLKSVGAEEHLKIYLSTVRALTDRNRRRLKQLWEAGQIK